jgi:hypothetical protein
MGARTVYLLVSQSVFAKIEWKVKCQVKSSQSVSQFLLSTHIEWKDTSKNPTGSKNKNNSLSE